MQNKKKILREDFSLSDGMDEYIQEKRNRGNVQNRAICLISFLLLILMTGYLYSHSVKVKNVRVTAIADELDGLQEHVNKQEPKKMSLVPIPFTEANIRRTIIGEAGNQGERGMQCVAEVIRNTGSLKGLFGYYSAQPDKEPLRVWEMAIRAYKRAQRSNITKGATHFENVKKFGEPYWAKSMKKVYEYKDHVFYKEIK